MVADNHIFIILQADRKAGVSVHSPPSCLPYITASGAKRARIHNTDGSGSSSGINSSGVELLAQLLGANRGRSEGSPNHDSPLSSPPNESHIEEYLEFLGIRDKDHVLEILLANSFHSHKLFKSGGLARADVKALGLTLGVVTMLFDNVTKFKRFMS